MGGDDYLMAASSPRKGLEAHIKAVVCTAYGPPEVLRMKEVDPPRLRRNGVCIRIFATAVTASDCLVRGVKFRGWRRLVLRAAIGVQAPRVILGNIASGEVESVGRNVTAFKPGDQAFGIGGFHSGTYAEKVCWPASAALSMKPAKLTFEEAAALP